MRGRPSVAAMKLAPPTLSPYDVRDVVASPRVSLPIHRADAGARCPRTGVRARDGARVVIAVAGTVLAASTLALLNL